MSDTTALITIEELSIYATSAGYNINAENDNELFQSLIDYKTEEFNKYVGCTINSTDYIEYYDGDGSSRLYLYKRPVISITSVHDDINWEYDTDTLIDTTEYKLVNNRYIQLKTSIFNVADQNIKVIYTAGYSEVPGDIKLACIKEVLRDFNDRTSLGISSKTDLINNSIQYLEKGLMTSTKDVLDKYRHIGVV